jgi:hypothetical protein
VCNSKWNTPCATSYAGVSFGKKQLHVTSSDWNDYSFVLGELVWSDGYGEEILRLDLSNTGTASHFF